MWTLVVLFITTMGSGSSAMTSVPGFDTEQLCKHGGSAIQVGNERMVVMTFCVQTSEDDTVWTERSCADLCKSAGLGKLNSVEKKVFRACVAHDECPVPPHQP